MIYQLKVSIKNTKPPIWRRILVDSQTTFCELNEIIQVAMDWSGSHLHIFEFNQAPQEKVAQLEDNLFSGLFQTFQNPSGQRICIGDPEHDDGIYQQFDENEEILAEWLSKEKDKCIYTYDFGDDWKHEILLEKILDPVQGAEYPKCIKVKRPYPEEDSGGVWTEDYEEESHLSEEEMLEEINEQLQALEAEYSDRDEESSPSSAQATINQWKELFTHVIAYKELKSWQWLSDEDIFAIQDPESNQIGYCCVLGQAEEEFGLAIYIGDEGLKALSTILSGEFEEIDSDQLVHIQSSLLLSFDDRKEITEEDYQIIKSAGLSFRGRKQWPMLRSFQPGYYPWYLNQEEVCFLTNVLPQVIEVCQRLLQNPNVLDSVNENHFFARLPERDGENIVWKDGSVSIDPVEVDDQLEKEVELCVDELYLQKLKKEWQKKKAVFEFDYFYSPQPVQEKESERPYFPYVSLWTDQHSGQILDMKMIEHEQYAQDIYESFLGLLQNLEWMPERILVQRKQAYNLLLPFTKRLGIALDFVKRLPVMQEAKKEMFTF